MCLEQGSFQAHIEQKEPSSVPLHVEKGLYSSFVFTATAAVSPGSNRNTYQNKESSCAKLRELLGWLFFGRESSVQSVHELEEQGGKWVPGNRPHL